MFALVGPIGCQQPAPTPPPPPPPSAPVAAAPAPDAAPPADHVIVVDRKCMGTLCEVKVFHHDEALVKRVVARGLDEMDRIEALTTS